MKRLSLLLCLLGFQFSLFAQKTPYENSGQQATATWAEAIEYYQQLAAQHPQIRLIERGKTDVGKPLHTVIVSKEGLTDPLQARAQGRRILLVNNGIHPGEPCGVDASMMLARDLMEKAEMKALLNEVVIVIIPLYNIGGSLNRSSYSRANQVGPAEYGFRGNARNFDLNRDFIKADTRNARSFFEIFQDWQPDVFIDTHTTNGADYPAVMTLIATQSDKLGPETKRYQDEVLTPAMYEWMAYKKQKMCPYVNSIGTTPDKGIAAFMDSPRYSTGYTALFQTMSFVTEAHMLKSFAERVEATYVFLEGMIRHLAKNPKTAEVVQNDRNAAATQKTFDIQWTIDTSEVDQLWFDGYEAKYKKSEVSGLDRLYYDRNAPWRKQIPFLQRYKATNTVEAPTAYIIPQGNDRVIERLALNGVVMKTLSTDIKLPVEVSYIEDRKTSTRSYEGHFYHQQFTSRKEQQEIQFYAGDKVVFINQWRNPLIVHTLEPESQDAYFRWNFFDGILMQKEYFSSYVFEDEAARLLKERPELKAKLDKAIAENPKMAENSRAQLNFIYFHSEYYEKTHNRYPVARWLGADALPLDD
ncbi:MAG: M14 family zinc carboxypeptidase [Bacteroidota bacterium]